MKRLLFSILFSFLIAVFSACIKPNKTPSLSEPALSKSVDPKTSAPIEKTNLFTQSDAAVYFTFIATDLPGETKLTAVWKYLNDGTEIKSEMTTSGTGYKVFELKRSGSMFPAGKYEITVNALTGSRTLELKNEFEIAAEAKTTHLVNPVTAKSVDSSDKLEPSDITSQFTQSDQVIYFIVQSKDLPKDTKVRCTWVYKTTGDSIPGEITTDGSRNIVFSLKPDQGRKLPVGMYIVTASVSINNQVESISKEFEIIE